MTTTKWYSAAVCPVCNRRGCGRYCIDDDRMIVKCYHEGTAPQRRTKNGHIYYIHMLPVLNSVPPAQNQYPKAGPELTDSVYRMLLSLCELTSNHRRALLDRGMTQSTIDENRFGSLPPSAEQKQIMKELCQRFTVQLCKVPGFGVRDNRVKILGPRCGGILIPVFQGDTLVALKVRRDGECEKHERYQWLSTWNGPSTGTPLYFPAGFPSSCPEVRITEGEIKATIAQQFTGLPTIGVPGVGATAQLFDLVKTLGCKKLRLAFDHGEGGGEATDYLLEEFRGYRLSVEVWPPQYKGIDDALVAYARVLQRIVN